MNKKKIIAVLLAAFSFVSTNVLAQSAKLSWVASTSTVVGYKVYRGNTTGGTYVSLTPAPINGLTYTDSTIAPGNTYYYVATSVDSNNTESTYSNEAVAVVPVPPPPVITCPAPATNSFTGCYYATTAFGKLLFTRNDPTINFNWNSASPNAAVPTTQYSVRWQGNFTLTAGTYQFTTSTDDGVRLYLDGVMLINDWTSHAVTTHTFNTAVTAGTHLITVEYYQAASGATAIASWANVAPLLPVLTFTPLVCTPASTPATYTCTATATIK